MIKPFPLFIRRDGLITTRSDEVVKIDNLIWSKIESIGDVYSAGFGVGICHPKHLPAGFQPLYGTYDRGSPNYGNYIDAKGNVLVYIPKCWLKIDYTKDPFVLVKDWDFFASEAQANDAGYWCPEAFMQGDNKRGKFFFKYKASKISDGTGFSCGSKKFGKPLTFSSNHNPVGELTVAGGVYNYYIGIDAVKAIDGVNGQKKEGSIWYVPTMQDYALLSLLSLAIPKDAQYCAWRHPTKHYPLGCNNSALCDSDFTDVKYIWDGYENPPGTPIYCGLTGSANQFARTTHNGQACGIADVNGLIYEMATGMTCIGITKSISMATKANPCQITTTTNHGLATGDKIVISGVVGMTQLNDKLFQITVTDETHFNLDIDSTTYTDYVSGGTVYSGSFYIKKTTFDPTLYTSGNTLATDMWGATGVANWGDLIDIPIPVAGNSIVQRFGNSTNPVFENNTRLTNAGLPKDTNAIGEGTDTYGKDYYYLYFRNELCCLRCCYWSAGSGAGVFGMSLGGSRSYSDGHVGFRACCFPD